MQLPSFDKARAILTNVDGSYVIDEPSEWSDGIVCVVDNGHFEAAAYAYDAARLSQFKRDDGRYKIWLHVPNAKEYAK